MRTWADESRIAISWLAEQGWVDFEERIPVVTSAGLGFLARAEGLDVHQAAKILDARGAPNPHFALKALMAVALDN